MNFIIKNKKGSITLETSIAFSIVLVLIAAMLNVLNIYRTDILMQRSVSYVNSEFSIYTPLTIITDDMVYTANRVLPEDTATEFNNSIANLNTNIQKIFGINNLTSSILDLSLSHTFESSILDHYIELNNGSSFYAPDDIDVDFRIDDKNQIIFVEVNYIVSTVFGDVNRTITDAIPFWGDFSNFEAIESSNSYDESNAFWNMGNFERGTWLREHYNANLPMTFPVINGYSNGEIFTVTSIDLNSSWNSNESNLRSRLNEEIEDMISFEGANVNINGTQYQIDSTDIESRRIIIVIPSNSSTSSLNIVYEYEHLAELQGINVDVVQMGES